MISLSRRQFASATLLAGLGALVWPHNSIAQDIEDQTDDLVLAQPIAMSQLMVDLPINDVPLTFLIDTSRSYSLIDAGVASMLGLVATGEQIIPSLGPTLQSQLYGATLASGDNTFGFQLATVDDLSLVSEYASNPEMEGILGADFLGQFTDVSLTDTTFTGVFNGSTSRVRGGGLFVQQQLPPPFTVTYPVRKIGNQYFVAIRIIDGTGATVTRIFLLDTGASVSLLTTQQALNMGLLPLQIGPAPFIPAMVPIRGIGGGVLAPITPVGIPGLGTRPFVIGNVNLRPGVVGLLGADVLGGSFTLQMNGGQGTLTITTPLGQYLQFLLSIARLILSFFGVELPNATVMNYR
ncbi:MAG: hypothetical protein AB1489_15585 [Acidobacteriota bacterium]